LPDDFQAETTLQEPDIGDHVATAPGGGQDGLLQDAARAAGLAAYR